MTETMNKTYIAPQSQTISFNTENVILTGSIVENIDSTGEGLDNVELESNQRGWSSESWTNED